MSRITPLNGTHAVVIGGSSAGMIAARILADHFTAVTLLERDSYPETPQPRKGVPQSRHLHVLLARGGMILEQLFPCLRAALEAAGGEPLDAARDIDWLSRAGPGLRFASAIRIIACSREFLARISHKIWVHRGVEVVKVV
jgi:2-polyprenyl-6-methoxyphenol hydroxylase-like FAD-dependent oxidoreductase